MKLYAVVCLGALLVSCVTIDSEPIRRIMSEDHVLIATRDAIQAKWNCVRLGDTDNFGVYLWVPPSNDRRSVRFVRAEIPCRSGISVDAQLRFSVRPDESNERDSSFSSAAFHYSNLTRVIRTPLDAPQEPTVAEIVSEDIVASRLASAIFQSSPRACPWYVREESSRFGELRVQDASGIESREFSATLLCTSQQTICGSSYIFSGRYYPAYGYTLLDGVGVQTVACD